MGDRTIIGGGLLPFSHEAATALLGGLAAVNDASEGPQNSQVFPAPEAEILRKAAPILTTAWLLDVLPKALGEMPIMTNRDGEEPVFH